MSGLINWLMTTSACDDNMWVVTTSAGVGTTSWVQGRNESSRDPMCHDLAIYFLWGNASEVGGGGRGPPKEPCTPPTPSSLHPLSQCGASDIVVMNRSPLQGFVSVELVTLL